MGGLAARERRRLQRLGLSEEIAQHDTEKVRPKTITSPNKKNLNRDLTEAKHHTKTVHKGPKTITKKKVTKKPKHLNRLLQNTTDPDKLKKLEKLQDKLNEKKQKRVTTFKDKVIKLVGGTQNFDEDGFLSIMNSGAKLETIIQKSTRNNHDDTTKTSNIMYSDTNLNKNNDGNKNQKILKRKNHSDVIDDDKSKSKMNKMELKNIDSSKVESNHNENSTNVNDRSCKNEISNTNSKSLEIEKYTTKNELANEGKDNEEENEMSPKRVRGRRRRGRQDADTKRDALNAEQQQQFGEKMCQLEQNEEPDTASVTDNTKTNDKNSEKDQSIDSRRCKGRKPVTDFQIGHKYTGKVVYIKPYLGVFIDIGCHSDAFCHISRISDDYVESITDEIMKVGDVLTEKVRVVEISREKKRITVSLQTDARLEDELKSTNARKERRREKKKNKNNVDTIETKEVMTVGDEMNQLEIKPTNDHKEVPIDESTMTPAELKRHRKLQRREERRKLLEITGIHA